ncbi:hypothetical protein CWI42_050660 [Ordospora colligata]|uniref:Uncharacterized protein n=1 Tax=Ordospora colligata OC4 TaxID=1354746 RepID=A0A0B2UKW1_9MICR|nr:uncharacterized protein M896_050690 [Ordospora colligata OC4]KHN69662.1 hypothetical protein M896_050690 [Ordospora colligata OC4]TBU15781.1 hypothetical protein CWI41_050680 [Ordospora colligata]TBU15909.1 hypothetical protein CWI40_050700 [Ordospora colligata]TBU18803.1 hypothetical protein CWI42_050660 [Ordospora colligata]
MNAPRSQSEIPQEYLNNENPFAYMQSYGDAPVIDPKIKADMDIMLQMQPKYISIGINNHVLRTEQVTKTNTLIELHILYLLNEGLQTLRNNAEMGMHVNGSISDAAGLSMGAEMNARASVESLLKSNIDDQKVLDIMIRINRLKLLRSQERLREKVYYALRNSIAPETVQSSVFPLPIMEDALSDAIEYVKLCRPPVVCTHPQSSHDEEYESSYTTTENED